MSELKMPLSMRAPNDRPTIDAVDADGALLIWTSDMFKNNLTELIRRANWISDIKQIVERGLKYDADGKSLCFHMIADLLRDCESETPMPNEPKPPQRRFTMTMKLGADDIKSLIAELDHYAHCIEANGSRNLTSGGCTSGGHFEIVEDETMTHDKYFDALDAWRKKVEAQP